MPSPNWPRGCLSRRVENRIGFIKFSVARCLYSRPLWLFFCLSTNAAALILATWIAANPPADVMQSCPGIDIKVGHNRLIGPVVRYLGIPLSILASSHLGALIIQPAIKLQFSPSQPNAHSINGDSRAFLECLIIV